MLLRVALGKATTIYETHTRDRLLYILQTGGYWRGSILDKKAGFTYSVDVQHCELVCRLKKTCNYFDRSQSALWFDSLLVLPTTNLAAPIVWGEDKKKVGVLKVRDLYCLS